MLKISHVQWFMVALESLSTVLKPFSVSSLDKCVPMNPSVPVTRTLVIFILFVIVSIGPQFRLVITIPI